MVKDKDIELINAHLNEKQKKESRDPKFVFGVLT